jgi:hypothetical protein
MLIYEKPNAYETLTEDDRARVTGEYLALRQDPRVVDGLRLQPVETATTVRTADDHLLITDGPFAETKEVFGGFYVIQADDLDEVLELAAVIPALRFGGSVEIRPVAELPR